MERQRIAILALLAILVSGCQQTEVFIVENKIIEPAKEIIPVVIPVSYTHLTLPTSVTV